VVVCREFPVECRALANSAQVNSSDATSQLLNTFPTLIAAALNISGMSKLSHANHADSITESEVSTYGLQAYQPASWKRSEAQLLTTWLGYIPSDQFENLNVGVSSLILRR
jgi:hypothetical protein